MAVRPHNLHCKLDTKTIFADSRKNNRENYFKLQDNVARHLNEQ